MLAEFQPCTIPPFHPTTAGGKRQENAMDMFITHTQAAVPRAPARPREFRQ